MVGEFQIHDERKGKDRVVVVVQPLPAGIDRIQGIVGVGVAVEDHLLWPTAGGAPVASLPPHCASSVNISGPCWTS